MTIPQDGCHADYHELGVHAPHDPVLAVEVAAAVHDTIDRCCTQPGARCAYDDDEVRRVTVAVLDVVTGRLRRVLCIFPGCEVEPRPDALTCEDHRNVRVSSTGSFVNNGHRDGGHG